MIALQKHETLSLLYDKLQSISQLCDEIQGENSIKSLRHSFAEIKRIAKRACEVIDGHEPAEDRCRCEHCEVSP